MALMMPSATRRRLFDALHDRGRLVQDTVLLGFEVHIPHESLTAAALLDWVADGKFGDGPDCRSEAEWDKIACFCREAMLVDGRGARCDMPQKASGAKSSSSGHQQPDDGCHAVVRLTNGAVCRIYHEERARPDGAVAVLTPPPGGACVAEQVLELRYRADESVEVAFASGARLVKWPRKGLLFHEALSGERHVRRGELGGVCHEAANGSVAEVRLHSDMSRAAQAPAAPSLRALSHGAKVASGSGGGTCGDLGSWARRGSRQRGRTFQNTAVVRTMLGNGTSSLSEVDAPPEHLMNQQPVPDLMRRPLRPGLPEGFRWSRPSSRTPMPKLIPAP